MVILALVHILPKDNLLNDRLLILYKAYFSDLALPFGYYFLLCQSETYIKWLRHWTAKFACVFLAASLAETGQYFGIPILGSTFDALDYLMYFIGSATAVVFDTIIFPRMFGFWSVDNNPT